MLSESINLLFLWYFTDSTLNNLLLKNALDLYNKPKSITMKKVKFNIILLFTAIAFLISSCNFQCVEPEGPIITDTKVLEDFSGIEIGVSADVKLIIGDEPSLKITAPESYINAISTNVGRRILKVTGDVCKAENSDIKIVITSPKINDIVISGSADIYSDSPLRTDNLTLGVRGTGSISLNIFTNEVEAIINGSGNIILNGTSESMEIAINGSGDFKGLGLNSFKARVKISGSGNASVVAHSKLHAAIQGSGNINYSGDPEINMSISGSGKVNKIN